ncbi:MAG: tRNA lysidine(34) synthetase TilS [Proteiniphilum sp.]|jgi:tRNA(Ile)-lysidine synthase|nr:tRNA lysidine(34) synthetase TilS [Proteiniphilum sp.]
MLDTIRGYIEKEKLLTPNAVVIVGLSGGMDSMVLLDLLTLLGYQCIGAHCNFHLRGEESDRDAAFVQKWCKSTDIPFTTIDFDTREYAADKGISIEMAARELRYSWFEIIRRQYDAEAVAVAHHKDDSVETVLLNLIRGSGIRGLTGISSRHGKVIRPLLCVTRAEVEGYITERGIPYVFDSSNGDDKIMRNSLRLNIIPGLEALNPAAKEAIHRTSSNLAHAEMVYSASIKQMIDFVLMDDQIDIRKLRETSSPQSVFFEILSPLGFAPSTIEDALKSMDATPGKLFFSEQYRLIKDREYFIIDRLTEKVNGTDTFWIYPETTEISSPLNLKLKATTMPAEIKKNNRFLTADYAKLTFPLQLRRWREGDWFIPLGMEGRKKLSDYFTDRKFSLRDKENVWVLLSGDDIVWIVGERTDNRYRVTDKTVNLFMVELNKEE